MLRRVPSFGVCAQLIATAAALAANAGSPTNLLLPDIFPFVEPDAPSGMRTLQEWQLSGSRITFSTMFANQGDGLFEIRRGPDLGPDEHALIQRVYVDEDFGTEFIDIDIGTAPIPGTQENPNPDVPFPRDSNVIWFEDFTHFSLHEAPVVDGLLTVGDEVAGETKTSWRLSANRGPLPGFGSPPRFNSPDQTVQQRISTGWADLYGAGSSGQSFDITGVPVGPLYWLRQTVDPANRIMELDETNNSFEVLIDLARPGEAFTLDGEFVRPGDRAPAAPGDLNGDGLIDIDDWFAFKAGADAPLDGLGQADRLALGDLNNDGLHTLTDAVLFRQAYDAANGSGAFAALTTATPEPTTLLLVGVAAAGALVGQRRARRALILALGLLGYGAASTARVATARTVLFSEDFEGLPLGPNADEGLAEAIAWTDTPPPGWIVDDSGVPWVGNAGIGVEEWEGWSFADKSWWSATAGDQGRSDFDLGSGTVAVADADEWDDRGSPANANWIGFFDAFMSTPAISLTGVAPQSATLTFGSSWRDEAFDDGPSDNNNQTAIVRASYDGGAFTEVLRWESDSSSPFFKNDATNERVTIGLNNPSGASDVVLEFGLIDAGNDWWWAIDNVEVFAPATVEVDAASGVAVLRGVGGAEVTGYEVTSASGSLTPDAWIESNLDAQNAGAPVEATTDANNDGSVDAADYTLLRDAGQIHRIGAWANEYGASVGPGDSWETIIANDNQLIEFFLNGASTESELTLGSVFDTTGNLDLEFTYSTADGQEFSAAVVYGGIQSLAVPEPAALSVSVALLTFAACQTNGCGAVSRRGIE